MKKITFLIILMVFILSGCNNNTSTPLKEEEATVKVELKEEVKTEEPEEVVAVVEEIEEPEEEIITEEVTNESEEEIKEEELPNQEDFWNLNSFDLVGYLEACGADKVEPEYEYTLSDQIDSYIASFGDFDLRITTTNNDNFVPNVTLYNNKFQDGTFYIFEGKEHTENIILIDDENFTYQASIEALDSIIKDLKVLRDEDLSEFPKIDGFFY